MPEQPGVEIESGAAPPPSPAAVARTEQVLGVPLDKAYLAFLKQHNGGVPRQRYFPMGRNTKVVERFLCIAERGAPAPASTYDVSAVWGLIRARLAPKQVPFAVLFPGDFLCFDYQPGPAPRVVWWVHEASTPAEERTTTVAPSFDAFLAMLKSET